MNYEETIKYLYSQLPLFSRVGAAAYKADITNTVRLCEAIGNPQHKIRTIHIAGTNGKGSTSHILAAILQQSGYKTGLYTSPHLKDFRERIKVNGDMISKDFITAFVEQIKDVSEAIAPSFFELTVAMALQYFYEEKVDIAVIETGLGGRLDSTNIITPEVSIITNIGYDHMNILGDTLEKIAFEKAGIIKPGVPAVIGETLPETYPLFLRQAGAQHADLIFAEKTFRVEKYAFTPSLLDVTVMNISSGELLGYQMDLTGIYQQKNLCTVLTAIIELRKKGFVLTEENIKLALTSVKKINGLYGRWDVIHEHPMIVLDVAHNADGIIQLLKQITITPYRNLHIVIGMVKDKDIDAVLRLLPDTARYYFTRANIPRALDEIGLQHEAAKFRLIGSCYSNVNAALASAQGNSSTEDLIIVCGSVFLVGEVDNFKD